MLYKGGTRARSRSCSSEIPTAAYVIKMRKLQTKNTQLTKTIPLNNS